MARTTEDIVFCDEIAARIGYESPPARLEPVGKIYEDDSWEDLCMWWEGRDIPWADAIEVYISRRYDQSIEQVYASIDGWKGSRMRRRDIETDPDAVYAYGN